MRYVLTLTSLVLMSAPAALAQETVTFSFEFDHAVLQPGQSQGVRVFAHFEPGVGAYVPWNTNGGTGQLGQVRGFASAEFDILNQLNANTGTYSNMFINPLLFGWPGAVQPSGSVAGIDAFQFVGIMTQANPILLWAATWTPTFYDPRTVTLATQCTALPAIALDIGSTFPEPDNWTPIDGEGSFHVVPAPGAAALMGLAGFFLRHRPRR